VKQACVFFISKNQVNILHLLPKWKTLNAWWINLLKIRDDRRSELSTCWIPSSDGLNLWSNSRQFISISCMVAFYICDCYQRFTSNLSRLIPQQGPTLEDAAWARQSRHESATKDHSIFKPDCIFCNSEGEERNHDKLIRTIQVWKGWRGNSFARSWGEKGWTTFAQNQGLWLNIACEAQFHPYCRTHYLQMPTKWRSKDQEHVEEQASLSEAHRLAFSKVCQVISVDVMSMQHFVRPFPVSSRSCRSVSRSAWWSRIKNMSVSDVFTLAVA